MNLTHLEQFRTIARCENMAQASELLFVSQPALSYSVSKLEEELGVELFDRRKNRIILNEAGKYALEFANNILHETKKMKDFFIDYNGKQKSLTFGSVSNAAIRYFLPRFMEQVSNIRVRSFQTSQEDIKSFLLGGDCDIAISIEPLSHNNIYNMPFCTDDLTVCVPTTHRLAKKQSICFKNLSGETVVRPKDNSLMAHRIGEEIERNHLKEIVCDDYVVYRNLLEKTDYLFFVTTLGIPYLKNDMSDRKSIRILDEKVRMPVYISYLKQNRQKVEPFFDWIHKNYKELIR